MDVNDDGFVSLMDDTTYELRKDLKVPGGKIGEEIKEALAEDRNTKVRTFQIRAWENSSINGRCYNFCFQRI